MAQIDWIQGDKFVKLADFTYSPENKSPGDYDNLSNTLDFKWLKPTNIVYTHTIYIKQLFELIAKSSKQFIIITHNSDVDVNETFVMPSNVLRWYSQNVNVIDRRIESIPIGLENDRWFKHLRKKEKMLEVLSTEKQIKNLVYINHNVHTNPEGRLEPYTVFANKPWVTMEHGLNGKGFETYITNIYNHKFVICPRGNGMDTHRLWEVLYMNSIPIVKRDVNNSFYSSLPILYVDEWEQVTEDFLHLSLISNMSAKWNMEMLTFEYWKKQILRNVTR